MEPANFYEVPVWEGPAPGSVFPSPSLEVTWSILDSEPGMDDSKERAEGQIVDSLKRVEEELKIYLFQSKEKVGLLFLSRFEFPKFGEDFKFPEAVKDLDKPLGFIDFLAGFPIDCIEMLVAIGEYSSAAKKGEASKVNVQPGRGLTPPVPPRGAEGFFKWPEEDKILLNLTALPTKKVAKFLAKNLAGEPKPTKPHWWFRVRLVQITDKFLKFPVPGEFLGLGVRMMPGEYWGRQKSSPFIYSGYFMDTVYYSGSRISEVIEPTDEVPYPTYKVKWRKNEYEAIPTDFAEYKVDDRVTILKDVTTEKKTQLWKDEDMEKWGGKLEDEDMETEGEWVITPIAFYGLDTP